MTETVAAAGGRRAPIKRLLGSQPLGLLFASPYVVFVGLVLAYPFGMAVWMSFHDYFFTAPGAVVDRPFVGLANFEALVGDAAVRRSFVNIGVFLVINVPLTVVLGLGLAAALNSTLPLRSFFRAAYYIPYITASVATVGVWLWLFSSGGLVNQLLGPLAPNPSWLISEGLAMPTLALYVTWKQLGIYIVLYLAALQNIPRELYEAAAIDGASRLRSFFTVTVPAVRPATAFVTIYATITGANLFTEPYLLTGGGGPNGASATPVLLIYQRGIEQTQPDMAAAIGLVLVVCVLGISAVNRWLLERG